MTTLKKLANISYTPGTPYVPGNPGQAYQPGYYKTAYSEVKTPVYGFTRVAYGDFSNYHGGPPLVGSSTGLWLYGVIGYTSSTETTKTWVPAVPYVAPTPPIAAKPGVFAETGMGWNSGADTLAGGATNTAFTFKVPATSVGVVVGLTESSISGDYKLIGHGLYASHGKLTVIENGVADPYPVAYSGGDLLGVQRLGGAISYSRNGVVFKTTPSTLDGYVFGTAALYMAGDSVVDAKFRDANATSTTTMLPMSGIGYAGVYAQALNTMLPLETMASGRRLDGVQAFMLPLLSFASNRASGHSLASMEPLTSAGTGQQYTAHSAASMQPLVSLGANKPYGTSAVSMLPLTGTGNEGMLAPAYAMSYGSFAYLLGAGHGLTGEVGSSAASMLPLKSISADHPYGSSEVSMEPMTSQLGNFVTANTCSLTAPMQRVYGTGHDSTGENSAVLTAPSPTLAMYGGASASLSAPFGVLSITATSVGWGKSALAAPMATLVSDGRVSGMANAALAPPMAKMVGYSGAVCDVTLTGRPTLVATGTTGAIGGATLTCPLFALVAEATAENHGSANLIAPSPRMVDTAQAWLVAPMARLVAIGSATVAVDYEAYSINLTHSDPEATDEVTRYTNFPFERIVRYQGSYFGMAADGLYLLEGTTDDGEDIAYAVQTATTDFGSPMKKTAVSAYLGARFGPAATVSLYAGEKDPHAYHYSTPRDARAQNHRQRFGRGIKERYLSIGVSGTDALELDSIEFEIATMTRRL